MIGDICSHALSCPVLIRNGFIALVVGTILVTANLSGRIAEKGWTSELLLQAAFNYLVPFLVSTLSAAANRPKPQ